MPCASKSFLSQSGWVPLNMPQFIALITSSEDLQRVMVDAANEGAAVYKLELDYGKGCVREVKPYAVERAVGLKQLALKSEDVLKYSRAHGRKHAKGNPPKHSQESGRPSNMVYIIGALVVCVAALLTFGKFLLAWFTAMFVAIFP